MSPGFIEYVQGRFTQGKDEVEKVGEQVDGACVLIVVETLLLIMEHCIVRGTGAQTIAGIRIEEAVGGDYEIGVVGREIHGERRLNLDSGTIGTDPLPDHHERTIFAGGNDGCVIHFKSPLFQ